MQRTILSEHIYIVCRVLAAGKSCLSEPEVRFANGLKIKSSAMFALDWPWPNSQNRNKDVRDGSKFANAVNQWFSISIAAKPKPFLSPKWIKIMRHYFKILCVLAAWLPPAMEVSSRNLVNAFLCVYLILWCFFIKRFRNPLESAKNT